MSNLDEPIFFSPMPAKQCRACAMSHGPAPHENGPTKAYCLAYRYDPERDDGGLGKPYGVMDDWVECENFTHYLT